MKTRREKEDAVAAKHQQRTSLYAEDNFSDEEENEEDGRARSNGWQSGRDRRTSRFSSPESPRLSANVSGSSPTRSVTASLSSVENGQQQHRRRGRGPSKRPCLNRNALMARENRLKKKAYIERVEHKLEQYRTENEKLKALITKQNIKMQELANKAGHYKSVLSNSTEISMLLGSLNDSLKRMHGDRTEAALDTATTLDKIKPEARWTDSTQANMTNTNNKFTPTSGLSPKDNTKVFLGDKRKTFGQSSPPKIARKTMPLINDTWPRSEEPSSVESIFEEDDPKFEQSPESYSYCEYNVDASSIGLGNQLPTTPMSAVSSSLDKGEASLSETDFNQLKSFNDDLFNFDKLDNVSDPLNLGQDIPDTFHDDALFDMLDTNPDLLDTDINDLLDINKISDTLNKKTFFNTLVHTGICLHINSSRVTLEYCSKCYENSLSNSEIL